MLVEKFSCPDCGAVLKPATPQPEGKRIKCPKCSKTFSVAPMPDSESPAEESENPYSVAGEDTAVTARNGARSRRRGAAEDEEETDPTPVRSRRRVLDDDDDEDDADELGARPARGRSKKRKKSAGLPPAARTGLIVGGILLGIALLGGGGYYAWNSFGGIGGIGGTPKQRGDRLFNKAADIMSTITDRSSAEAARPKLVAVGQQLNAVKTEVEQIKASGQQTEMTQMKPLSEKEAQEFFAPMNRMNEQAARVATIDGGPDTLDAFYQAWGVPSPVWAMKLANQAAGHPVKPDINPLAGNPGAFNPGAFGQQPAGQPAPAGSGQPGAFGQPNFGQPAPAPFGPGGTVPGWPPPNAGFGGGNSKLTRANYAQVRVGMSEQQLYDLLGPPTLTHPNFGGPTTKALHYTGFEVGGVVTVRDGVVIAKTP